MDDGKPVGVIGLGEIGGGLAASLIRRGRRVIGFDIAPEACARAALAGVEIASGLAALLLACDTAVTSLASLAAIERTYFAPGGIVAAARPGFLAVECSTTPPPLARRITDGLTAAGAAAVEAPVIGRGAEAREGRLLFLAAGETDAVRRAAPLFALAGRGHVHVGASGAASVVKLINNAIGQVTLCAIAEALTLAGDLGIEPSVLVRAIDEGRGAGCSVVFDRHAAQMADWRSSTRPPSDLELKDARSLAELIGDRERALPFLAGMAAHYEAVLPGAHRPQAETLMADAAARLARRNSQRADLGGSISAAPVSSGRGLSG